MNAWDGNGPKHRPVYDAENEHIDIDIDNTELAAFSYDDIHGLRDMFRRLGWTVALCVIVVAIGLGMFWAWRATQ